jgi:Tol biopolymer transport system component
MKPERWQEVDRLLEAALERAPEARANFLATACGGDDELRREVESLVASHEKASGFLSRSPVAVAGPQATGTASIESSDPLVGTTLDGRYEIVRVLGRGGFGVVYLARHVLLRDHVAIKVLHGSGMLDSTRIERFLREGRAARALHHPNAVAVYDLRAVPNGPVYMVQEYAPGRTLRELLDDRGQLSPAEALELIEPVASALDAAHVLGIVHRDVKPENIMVGEEGGRPVVKLLDLGIAKIRELLTDGAMASNVTQTGQLIGTPAYMSPEQWGEPSVDGETRIDGRADVYSLGVTIFEMVSGRRPFAAPSIHQLLKAHLSKSPPLLHESVASVPGAFGRAVARAMAKDRNNRPATAGELVAELRAAVEGTHGETSVRKAPLQTVEELVTRPWGIGLVVALAALAVVALALLWYRAGDDGSEAVLAPQREGTTVLRLTSSGKYVNAAISGDGKFVAAVVDDAERQSIELIQVATSSSTRIVGPADGSFKGLTFSPDGAYLYYTNVEGEDGGTLYRVPAIGGTSARILTNIITGVTFSPDGARIAFIRQGPDSGRTSLVVASADGSDQRVLATRTGRHFFGHGAPAWSPDGASIACSAGTSEGGLRSGLVEIRVADGTERQISELLWYYAEKVLWLGVGAGVVGGPLARPLEPNRLFVVSYPDGAATRITTDTSSYISVSATDGGDTLVAVQTALLTNLWVSKAGDGRDGVPVTSGASRYFGVRWMPDGRILTSTPAADNPEVLALSADGSGRTRLTQDPAVDRDADLSADGRVVVFTSNRSGRFNIWRMTADGRDPVPLTDGDDDRFPSMTPDGRWVVYQKFAGEQPTIWKVPIDGGAPTPLTDMYSNWPTVSPDGRFVACVMWDPERKRSRGAVIPIDGGAPVARFDIPVLEVPTWNWQRIRWTADARGLLYIDDHGGVSNVWLQPIDGGAPRQVTRFISDRIFDYDIAPSGALVCARGAVVSDVVTIRGFARRP